MQSGSISGKVVSADGNTVHYTVHGAGPTIMLVHGWCCDGSSWRYQSTELSCAYRVVVIDLPGHGKSGPASNGLSMSAFANAIQAVRADVTTDRIVLVGHSMGAIVIREYALDYPEYVAGLVAADGPLDVRKLSSWNVGSSQMVADSRKGLINRMFGPFTTEALRAEITEMMLSTPASAAIGVSNALRNCIDRSHELITTPALTIYAGIPLFGQDLATKEVLPEWESLQIPGTGHFVMMERPQDFNRILAGFLRSRAVR
jgi:pimeloyl-ACP methyl ester carboxylesterase